MTAPRVLFSGRPGTGRHALAERVASELGVPVVDGDVLRQRHPGAEVERDRWATLAVVELLTTGTDPVVAIDDGALYRLPSGHGAFTVELTAVIAIRTQRDSRRGKYLRAGDVQRETALRRAFAISAVSTTAREWQADLVMGCPETYECPDLAECEKIQSQLLDAALWVYRAHLTDVPASTAATAFAAFADARAAYPGYVRSFSPALDGPARGVGPMRWARRVLDSLDPFDGVEGSSYV